MKYLPIVIVLITLCVGCAPVRDMALTPQERLQRDLNYLNDYLNRKSPRLHPFPSFIPIPPEHPPSGLETIHLRISPPPHLPQMVFPPDHPGMVYPEIHIRVIS